jgi:hypothetical protein
MIIFCGIGDFAAARTRLLSQDWELTSDASTAPLIMPLIACCVAHSGNNELAAQILGNAFYSKYYHPTLIAEWGTLKRLQADLEAKLGADGYMTVLKQGEQRDTIALIQESAVLLEITGEDDKKND